jgi:transglutaminase-like putative cysteine protease
MKNNPFHDLQGKWEKMPPEENLELYLQPTPFIDSDSPFIMEFAKQSIGGAKTDIEKAVKLFYAVRDEIRYDPYNISFSHEGLKASTILGRRFGYCVAKAVVLTAAARAVGIPARLGFADVVNHLATERLKSLMQTDVFAWHGFSELFLYGRWVKATPTFNISLCRRFGVKPLEFDGRHDALFHEFDSKGNRHMQYVCDHGSFADLPYGIILENFKKHYPAYFRDDGSLVMGNFEKEAMEDRKGKK